MWLLYLHVPFLRLKRHKSSSELQLHYECKVSLDDGDKKWQKEDVKLNRSNRSVHEHQIYFDPSTLIALHVSIKRNLISYF